MKLSDLYWVLAATDWVRVYDMDPVDATPGDALFDGLALNMRRDIGELFDARVSFVTGSYEDSDIVIQIEEVDC